MPQPQQEKPQEGTPVTGMLVNFEHKTLTLVGGTEPLATLRLDPSGVVFYDRRQGTPELPQPAAEVLPSVEATVPQQSESEEKPKTVTLSGRLKSAPRAGRRVRPATMPREDYFQRRLSDNWSCLETISIRRVHIGRTHGYDPTAQNSKWRTRIASKRIPQHRLLQTSAPGMP